MARTRHIMVINRRGPYGSGYAQEALEVALVGGAFGQRISLALIDDGVFVLRQGQDTAALGAKPFTAAYRALADFEVHRVYVERESLVARGMSADQLLRIPADDEQPGASLLEVVSSVELAEILAQQDILLNH